MAAGGEEVSPEREWSLSWTWRRNQQTPQLLVGMAEGLVMRGCGML